MVDASRGRRTRVARRGTRVANPGTEAFASGRSRWRGCGQHLRWCPTRTGRWPLRDSPQAPFLGQWLAVRRVRGCARLWACAPQQMAPDQRSWLSSPTRWAAGQRQQRPFCARRRLPGNCWSAGGKWLSGAMRQASHPKDLAAIEGSAVLGAAAGAGIAETLDPGDALTRFGGELAGGLFLDPVGKAVTAWNVQATSCYHGDGEVWPQCHRGQVWSATVAAIKGGRGRPEQVIWVLEAGNPYENSAAAAVDRQIRC